METSANVSEYCDRKMEISLCHAVLHGDRDEVNFFIMSDQFKMQGSFTVNQGNIWQIIIL